MSCRYATLLQQRPSEDDYGEVPLRPLTVGWGLSPDFYPPTGQLSHNRELVRRHLEHLDEFIGNLSTPTGGTLKVLQEWRRAAHRLSWPGDGASMLQRAVVWTMDDLLERHPTLKTRCVIIGSPAFDIDHDVEQYLGWLGEGMLDAWVLRLDVDETKGSFATHILSLSPDMAGYYLSKIVDLSKEHVRLEMGIVPSRAHAIHFLQLVILVATEKSLAHILLASHQASLLLRLSRSPAGELVVHCSDLIFDCYLLPSLLVSVQLEYIGLNRTIGPYINPTENRKQLLYKPQPHPSLLRLPLQAEKTLEDLDADEIVLAFAPKMAVSTCEHYDLFRTENGVDRAKPHYATSSKPMIVASVLIGEGTCGMVYLAHHGPLRIAVKIRRKGLEGRYSPRCFGLWKGQDMTVLLTEYCGNALETFIGLSIDVRLTIFRALKALEDAGISQGSLAPRNVLRDENGVYRVIDFHRATFEEGRTAEIDEMYRDYLHREGEENHYDDTFELDLRHVIPLPETDDSDLLSE